MGVADKSVVCETDIGPPSRPVWLGDLVWDVFVRLRLELCLTFPAGRRDPLLMGPTDFTLGPSSLSSLGRLGVSVAHSHAWLGESKKRDLD